MWEPVGVSRAFTLLHLSDLHFANPDRSALTPEDALKSVAKQVAWDLPQRPLHVAITGDITTRGQTRGYNLAYEHLRTFFGSVCPTKVVLCPGNHDISTPADNFAAYNQFVFRLTNDRSQLVNRQSSVARTSSDRIEYIVVNSAFEEDHTYGSVQVDALVSTLRSLDRPAIAIAHHNPLSSRYASHAIVNSYEFLTAFSGKPVVALLSGHIHGTQALEFGPQLTRLVCTGSIGFPPEPNMSNQFGLYRFESDRLVATSHYSYSAQHGCFAKTSEWGRSAHA